MQAKKGATHCKQTESHIQFPKIKFAPGIDWYQRHYKPRNTSLLVSGIWFVAEGTDKTYRQYT